MPGIPPIEPYSMPTPESLPRNEVQWTVTPERAVLLVHDMQSFFLRPFDVVPEFRDELVDNIAALLRWSRSHGVQVAYTAQPGDMTPEQRGLLRDFWGPGMRVDPADRAIVPRLAPEPRDWQFTKWRYSAFFRSDLARRMADAGRDQLILCGVYAHVGVQATAVDAFSNDIAPFVVSDALGDFDERHHRNALEYVAQRCAAVVRTDAVLACVPAEARLGVR
ncbi:isochorismatase family protein [Saccharothrix hoggarensis]|uniref:Isochorismatase family protein n=1 Tax=Saccharothrix hoggarensis TaxID=913853 RepID=A0ABW3QTE1_9PSEU